MGFKQLVQGFCTGIQVGVEHMEFRELLEKDRQTACDEITAVVQRLGPEQLDQFEQAFLRHSIVVVGQSHRLRAIELYAFLKLQETAHYNAFRGFVGDAGVLA